MEEGNYDFSPRLLARLAGVLYLIIIAGGLFCEVFVRGRLIVSGDVAATAAHLRASEMLWRAGIAVDLFTCACTVVLAWSFYLLLRQVSPHVALLMVFFDLIGIGTQVAFDLNLITALFPLGNAAYLKVFTPEQLNAIARLSIRSHGMGFGISLLFFGFTFLPRGFLILQSGFLPKVLGTLLLFAGFGYCTHSFVMVLAPAFADRIFPILAVPIFIGEVSLCLWLLLKGVNVEKWKRQAENLSMQ